MKRQGRTFVADLAGRAGALLRSDQLRSIGMLVGGTATAHAITALAMPVSTRLFTPEDFSAAAAFASLVAILVVAASLRFDIAIALPEDDEEGFSLLALSLACAVGASLLLALVMSLLPPSVTALLGQPRLEPYLWLLPLAVLFGSVYLALQMWFVRRKAFAAIARSRIFQASSAAAGQIGLGALGYAPLGLIVGQLLNYGAGSVTLAVRTLMRERALFAAVTVRSMGRAFVAHQRFPRYSVWEALANAASINAPILLIAALAEGPEAGYLALAIFLLQAPMAVLGNSVQQVYLAGAPQAAREGRIGPFTAQTLGGLLRAVAPPLLFLAIVSPAAFGLVFGAEWTRSGVLVAWMVPWFLMQFLASPVSSGLHVMARQRTAMVLQIAGLILRVGSVLAAGIAWPGVISEAYALSGFVFYAAYLVVVMRAVGVTAGDLIRPARQALPYSAAAVAAGVAAAFLFAWLAERLMA